MMKVKYKMVSVIVLYLMQTTICVGMQDRPRTLSGSSNAGIDVFEQFALQENLEFPGLEPNPAPELPATELPWDISRGEGFKPLEKIRTQEQLEEELERMRRNYEPFMRRLAPALPVTRSKIPLTTFEWKLISSVMEPVTGEKEWEMVTIPHYTGPINKAEAAYRKELVITQDQFRADKLFLHFNAADYIVEVFVNGEKVGDHTGLFGAFEFDIKPRVRVGKNLLEIKIFNDAVMMGDPFNVGPDRNFGKKIAAAGSAGWDNPDFGWYMSPAGFGIWQDVYLETRANTYINSFFVRPVLDEGRAEVWVELPQQHGNVEISYSVYGQNFQATIAENEVLENMNSIPAPASPGFDLFKFSIPIPGDQLRIWSLDEPWLYQVQVMIKEDGELVDAAKRHFGMRSFVQSETSIPKGRFYLNGEEIKLRGANMMGNLMQSVMRKDYDQLRDDILLAKIANMNFWRMTQQPCQSEVYDYFDQLGLLAQTDFPTFNGIRADVEETAKDQFVEMIKLVRGHPSNVMLSYLNEPDFNKPMMLNREGHERLFTSFDGVAERLNPGQVTKWVDGDYVNLSHRYSDHHNYDAWYGEGIGSNYFGNWFATRAGWMHACGEFGVEGLADVSLMEKYYPGKWLETAADGTWSPELIPRCQTPNIGAKWQILKDSTMQDWVYSSQQHQMWATRLFTEALRRDSKMNSFAIHLLIDAWPVGWLKSIVDYDRQAKPAFFAYRDALSPLAVNLRPDAFYGFSGDMIKIGVWIANDTPKNLENSSLKYQVEFGNKVIRTGESEVSIPASQPEFKGWVEVDLPDVLQQKEITVRVGIFSEDGKPIHESDLILEVFPTAFMGKEPGHPGGWAQQLIKK